MRIIIISDTHRNRSALEKIVSRNLDADMFIHLGDGETDVNYIITKYPETADKFHHVAGNCDFNSLSPESLTLTVGKHRIYATHGHIHGVKYSLDDLIRTARDNNCDIALYGHTHISQNSYLDGMYVLNPGSASIPKDGRNPSFGCINITDGGVVTNIADV